MAKIIVYNVSSQALEVFYRGESDNMPYAYGNTMKVREFRGSSSSNVLWTTNATMESWNATRRSFNAPIPFRYAFKRIWEGGHGQQSQHYAGTALDCGQALSSSERNRLWRTANSLGVWSYVEPQSLTPTWVHVDKRYGTPACSAGYPTLRSGSRGVYVLVLQDALNALGFSTQTLDGAFGSNTGFYIRHTRIYTLGNHFGQLGFDGRFFRFGRFAILFYQFFNAFLAGFKGLFLFGSR